MGILSVSEALAKTFASLPPTQLSTVPLVDAVHHILAERIQADRDLPPFDKSAVDGYAIAPVESTKILPFTFKVKGLSKAGSRWPGTLKSGEACQIMTGAPVPPGAERIIMVEDTTRVGDSVRIATLGEPQQHIQPRGREVQQGSVLLSPGTWIRSSEVGVLATVGKSYVQVFRKPTIGVLATGDELVEPDIVPGADQIRNSNGYALTAQIRSSYFEVTFLGVARDTKADTLKKIEMGLQKEVLILSGGVSKGEFDYVKDALLEKGALFEFDQIAIKPGKPLVFGKVQNTYIFGLPGNPGSSFTTCELFVLPFLKGWSGFPVYRPRLLQGILNFEIKAKGNRTHYLPVLIELKKDVWTLSKLPYAGSADVLALALANGFLVVEPDHSYRQGELAPFLFFSENAPFPEPLQK
ncbi:MAG: gephyrin-like molybdotransferase Glp [Planctomycetota bacterium]